MSSLAQPPVPPYRRIVEEIRTLVVTGALQPGDRVPSVRQIAQQWGVAIATATKVTAALREEGLVEAKVGSGTVVSAGGRRVRGGPAGQASPAAPSTPVGSVGPGGPAGRSAPRFATAPSPRRTGAAKQGLSRRHVVQTAVAIADVEGLDAVSMRRLAFELDAGPMSLYRHVANKDELVKLMAAQIFGEPDLPEPGPDGWRAKLELLAHQEWRLFCRHLWLPRAVSFTRPLLVPSMMAHTEWALRALDGLGLSRETCMREALTLHALVLSIAMSRAEEIEEERDSGVTLDRWWRTERSRAEQLLNSGRFPLTATVSEAATDLDGLLEYSLARHLDGFAVLIADQGTGPDGATEG